MSSLISVCIFSLISFQNRIAGSTIFFPHLEISNIKTQVNMTLMIRIISALSILHTTNMIVLRAWYMFTYLNAHNNSIR